MSSIYDNVLSNMSYTNKDFNSIYAELLDVADKISPEWHPSTSNESDPGVLLLKLDAILADKLNYNIDKNILEVFPDSVTQYPNARQIFEQCGYNMKHYQAAEVIVSLTLDNEPNADNFNEDEPARTYTLPRFTMLTDKDKSVIYTIVDPDIILKSDGLQCEFRALQGVKTDLVLNNERLITYSNLDYNNRIYFKQINVAENGIFIRSASDSQVDYNEWKKVDNLYTEAPMTKCYKFGVDRDSSKCYIEFTPDIAALIGEGLYITYLTTDGLSGNIGRNTISKFYPGEIIASMTQEQTNPNLDLADASDIAISADNVYIVNNLPSVNGKNPETISEARKNYMRVKNTFNTLVSLQDYTNFLLTSDEVGNGFVCDRTTDIRSSAKVVTYDGFDESIKTCFRKSSDDATKDEMNAFNLKIYATKNIYPVTSTDAFELTFDQAPSGYIYNLRDAMEEIKCIQHDFIEHKAEQIVNIQLRYPIIARIMPASKLELSQQLEIQQKIIKNLISKLNATEITFGSEISYEDIYDTILKSDSRIRAATLDDITYTPYIIYSTNVRGEYNSMELCPELKVASDGKDLTSDEILHNEFWREIKAKCILAGYSDLFKRKDNFTQMVSMADTNSVKSISQLTTNTELSATIKDKVATVKLEDNESIYLTIPSYITEMSFGNNCKYFYKLNKTVSKDEIYQLTGDDEYIMFCWTEDSESTAPYYYAQYRGDSKSEIVIQPTMQLESGNNLGEKYAGLRDWIANQPETDSTKISDSQAISTGDNTQLINNLIRSADESILSGTKSIKKLKLNKIDFQSKKTPTSPGYKLYWILNTVTNNEYVLDFSNNNTYTLRSGEYLFYTTLSGKSFSLLGAGTKLQLTATEGMNASSTYSVTAKSYDEVLTGTNNLLNTESLWYELPEHVTISATEMEFYKIADKSSITFTLSDTSDTAESAQDGEVAEDDILTIDKSGIKIPTSSKIASISYTSSNNVEQELPSISISSAAWEGYSILSLNCSNTKEQKFTIGSSRKQSITYKDGDTDITWPDLDGDAETYYLQSSHALEDVGGINVDVTAVDYAGRKVPVDLFMYKYQEGQKLSNGAQIEHTLTKAGYSLSNIKGPAIIPVRVALATPGITITGCSILPDIASPITKNGMIYLYSEDTATITISETPSESKYSTIYIYPIIPLTDGGLDAGLLDIMTELDPNNDYNYMHAPDISTYIEDPVAPEAFLLEHHPYNRCTICKWDHGNSELKIINKLR